MVLIVHVAGVVHQAVVAIPAKQGFDFPVAGDGLQLQGLAHLPGVGPVQPQALDLVVWQRPAGTGAVDVGVGRAAGVVRVHQVPEVTKERAVLPGEHHIGVAGLVLFVPIDGQGGLETVAWGPVQDHPGGGQVHVTGIRPWSFLPAIRFPLEVGSAYCQCIADGGLAIQGDTPEIPGARAQFDLGLGVARGLAGDNADGAADAVLAEQRALGPAQHLDALHIRQFQVGAEGPRQVDAIQVQAHGRVRREDEIELPHPAQEGVDR